MRIDHVDNPSCNYLLHPINRREETKWSTSANRSLNISTNALFPNENLNEITRKRAENRELAKSTIKLVRNRFSKPRQKSVKAINKGTSVHKKSLSKGGSLLKIDRAKHSIKGGKHKINTKKVENKRKVLPERMRELAENLKLTKLSNQEVAQENDAPPIAQDAINLFPCKVQYNDQSLFDERLARTASEPTQEISKNIPVGGYMKKDV
jgi:hypothetical protein